MILTPVRCLVISSLSAFILTVVALSTAYAQPLDPGLRPGMELLEEGDYEEARDFFLAKFDDNPGSAQVNFYLGLAAFGLGDYESANLAFERTLMIEPDTERARLELARTYLKLGAPETAKSYFEEVLESSPPENVRRNVQRIIDQINAGTRKHVFSGTLMLGMNYDTNVGASPENTTVATPAFSVTVDDEKEDAFVSGLLRVEHKARLERPGMGWRSSAAVYQAAYEDESTGDLQYLRLSTGPSFEQKNRLIDLSAVGEYLAKESDDYVNALGGRVGFAQAFGGRHFLTATLTALSKEYDQDPDRRASNFSVTAGPVLDWGGNRATIRLGAEREECFDGDGAFEVDELSFSQCSVEVTCERNVPFEITGRAGHEFRYVDEITVYGGYKFRYVEYDEEYVVFAEDRTDRIHDVTIGLRKQVAGDLVMDLSHTYTNARSSIGLYEYRRDLTSLRLLWSF